MAAAFDVELPFPVRYTRSRRLSVSEVGTYRDIALTRGPVGVNARPAKNAFTSKNVQAAHLRDIMRQIDIFSSGSLKKHDFSLALRRAGVLLEEADIDNLFQALQSASTSRGCDIEMFTQLVKYWIKNNEDNTYLTLGKDTRGPSGERAPCSESNYPEVASALPQGTDDIVSEHESEPVSTPKRSVDKIELVSRGSRDTKAIRGDEEDLSSFGDTTSGRQSSPGDNIYHNHASLQLASGNPEVGKASPFPITATDAFDHSTPTDDRCSTPRRVGPCTPTISRSSSNFPTKYERVELESAGTPGGAILPEPDNNTARHDAGVDTRVAYGTSGGMQDQQEKLTDEVSTQDLGYGNLDSVLLALRDRQAAFQASAEGFDRSGDGRLMVGDFMNAVRQMGITLSLVQEAKLMDLLETTVGVVTEDGSRKLIGVKAGVAAIVLAGENGGRRILEREAWSPLEKESCIFELVSSRFADVYASLLPSSILRGPDKLRQCEGVHGGRSEKAFVTLGSLRNALRMAGLHLSEADTRTLWGILLRRANECLEAYEREGSQASRLVERGIVPLSLLREVMGFNMQNALHVPRRRQQQQQCMPPASGPWSVLDDTPGCDGAPHLLQKARLRLRGSGLTASDREQQVLACLPLVSPSDERECLTRAEMRRLLQRLEIDVRSGELQMLWYHTDRNEITREEFRRMLLDTSDSLPVTSPETPCPSPTAGLSSRPPPPPSRGQRSCSNDYTAPVGDVSEWSARQQQTLNCTAYEQNVRRAMGSDATYGNCELGRGAGKGQALGGCVSSEISPPSQAGGHVAAELPALLHRAIRRVAELDNAGEAVTMLVPDLGHNKDTRRVSRGGIQRALHGLGIIPRSGELQQLWWVLEKGGVGGPRITVEGFRSLLQGHTPKIDLLPEWTERDATRSGTEKDSYGARRDSVRGERVDEEERPAARIMKEVRAALGLVRRRMGGVVRGCEVRDHTGDGWVTEEAFMAVLKSLGILQQLGVAGRCALKQAVVVGCSVDTSSESVTAGQGETGAGGRAGCVRYTALIGSMEQYLHNVMSRSQPKVSVCCKAVQDRQIPSPQLDPSLIRHASADNQPTLSYSGNTAQSCPLPVPPPMPSHSLHGIATSAATRNRYPLNSVAHATRGWEDDSPEFPSGTRQFPRKGSGGVAALMRGSVDEDSPGDGNADKRAREPSPVVARTTPAMAGVVDSSGGEVGCQSHSRTDAIHASGQCGVDASHSGMNMGSIPAPLDKNPSSPDRERPLCGGKNTDSHLVPAGEDMTLMGVDDRSRGQRASRSKAIKPDNIYTKRAMQWELGEEQAMELRREAVVDAFGTEGEANNGLLTGECGSIDERGEDESCGEADSAFAHPLADTRHQGEITTLTRRTGADVLV